MLNLSSFSESQVPFHLPVVHQPAAPVIYPFTLTHSQGGKQQQPPLGIKVSLLGFKQVRFVALLCEHTGNPTVVEGHPLARMKAGDIHTAWILAKGLTATPQI